MFEPFLDRGIEFRRQQGSIVKDLEDEDDECDGIFRLRLSL